MSSVAFTPRGPFSLAAGAQFLEGFTPASYQKAADGVLRLAFASDGGDFTVAAALRQEQTADGGAAGRVRAEYAVHPATADDRPPPDHAVAPPDHAVAPPDHAFAGPGPDEAARAQLARILSLDVDGTGFPGLAAADPVVAALQEEFPGLRPVCFNSPYEAAAWAIIGQRIRMTQAAALKSRLARQYGQCVRIEGVALHAFPAPQVLRTLTCVPGLPDVKAERLHALADAADAGLLDAAYLRAMPADDALEALRTLPGIGPFSAELILIRGAGHPDVFPRHERRLHAAMADAYGLADPGDPGTAQVDRLAGIAERWRPYRSWIALLLRARAENMSQAGPSPGLPRS